VRVSCAAIPCRELVRAQKSPCGQHSFCMCKQKVACSGSCCEQFAERELLISICKYVSEMNAERFEFRAFWVPKLKRSRLVKTCREKIRAFIRRNLRWFGFCAREKTILRESGYSRLATLSVECRAQSGSESVRALYPESRSSVNFISRGRALVWAWVDAAAAPLHTHSLVIVHVWTHANWFRLRDEFALAAFQAEIILSKARAATTTDLHFLSVEKIQKLQSSISSCVCLIYEEPDHFFLLSNQYCFSSSSKTDCNNKMQSFDVQVASYVLSIISK
jgi:hypothetical protein